MPVYSNSNTRSRIPRHKRTLPISGDFDDFGKWFRCWHCGFINNIERNILDTSEYGRSGVVVDSNLANPVWKYLLTEDDEQILTEDGQPLLLEDNITSPAITGGCAFCGSKNYA